MTRSAALLVLAGPPALLVEVLPPAAVGLAFWSAPVVCAGVDAEVLAAAGVVVEANWLA
jgi:hypothetical protein